MVGVDFNHRPLVNNDFMIGFVSGGIAWMVGVSHVSADHKTVGECALILVVVECLAIGDAL